MARSASSRPVRTLCGLVALIAVIYGVIAAGVVFGTAQWTPKLALDLEGGTEIVLTAVPQPGTSGTVTQQTLDEAVNIIRQRINGSGVSEAEITTQGAKNIIVSLPGKPDEATKEAVKRAAALEFRPVLVEQPTAPPPTPTPTTKPSSSAGTSPKAGASGSAKVSVAPATASPQASATLQASPSASATATPSGNGMAVPRELLAATPTPTGTAGAASGSAASPPGKSPSPTPTNASDMNWITQGVVQQFQALDCTKAASRTGAVSEDLSKPLVTCSTDGAYKYILGPAELTGKDISSASASLETNSQGFTGTAWQVNLSFTSEGSVKFANVTQRLAGLQNAQNQFAIVLDGLVVSAPQTREAITGGQAQITGNFTEEQAQSLANQLKFGALPISFQVQTEENISATLGGEQLQRGLLAGLIGLVLVVLYSLAQYRALGLVTIASLAIAGVITYGLVVLLGWRQGYRLSLSGVAGLIVAIGITADSFIVYFERVRDEVRDGRPLQIAVESAWVRARRTIMISDLVSFTAAVVLFLLAIGGVRGFAFTLGLTTVVDVVVVFLFTHPTVVLLSRTRFFGGGHRLSGFDAEHLGRAVAYTGRGGVRQQPRRKGRTTTKGAVGTSGSATRGAFAEGEPGPVRTGTTIAERRAAAERAQHESAEPGSVDDGSGGDGGDREAGAAPAPDSRDDRQGQPVPDLDTTQKARAGRRDA